LRSELVDYDQRVQLEPVQDIRLRMESEDMEVICEFELHPDGLHGIFPSGQLSPDAKRRDIQEPLLPPLRHPDFVSISDNAARRKALFDWDTYSMTLVPCVGNSNGSRIVLVDMGASLTFTIRQTQPAVYLTELKLAFLDHVYAFEVKPKQKSVRKLPPHLLAAYHWINVGVSDPDSNLNPLKLLWRTFERTT
jgi:hypothetical protein